MSGVLTGDGPVPPAVAEVVRQFKRLTPAGRLRVLALNDMVNYVEALKAEEASRFPFEQEIAIAQRWVNRMRQAARAGE